MNDLIDRLMSSKLPVECKDIAIEAADTIEAQAKEISVLKDNLDATKDILFQWKQEAREKAKEIERLKQVNKKHASDNREFRKAIHSIMEIATTEPANKAIIEFIQSIAIDSGMHT